MRDADKRKDVAVLDIRTCEGGLTLLDDDQLVPLAVHAAGITRGRRKRRRVVTASVV